MEPEANDQLAPFHILVIEDELLVRDLLAEELRDSGFFVIEAANSGDALAYLNAGGRVDLVFSDIRMPGSMSGLDLARQLRERYPSLPIILTSGSHGPKPSDGLSIYLPKPYSVEQAISIVRANLGIR